MYIPEQIHVKYNLLNFYQHKILITKIKTTFFLLLFLLKQI